MTGHLDEAMKEDDDDDDDEEDDVDDDLFQIVPRMYYDAAEEMSKSSSRSNQALLQESCIREQKINEIRLIEKMNSQKNVLYGATIQL